MTSSDQILDWFYLNLCDLDARNYFLINISLFVFPRPRQGTPPQSLLPPTTHRNIADPTELTGIFFLI